MNKRVTLTSLTALVKTKYQKGESGNPAGKKKGTRNYATIYREALELLALKGDISSDDVEVMMTAMQISRALKGDTKAYDSVTDRAHGKAVQTNINKNIDDVELDEREMDTLNGMLAKFVRKPKSAEKKTAKKKGKAK